jgi:hypothetical protein
MTGETLHEMDRYGLVETEASSSGSSMDRPSFESADPIIDQLAEMVDQVLDSDPFEPMRQALARLGEAVGSRYSVNVTVSVDVFDPGRSNPLPLPTTGFSTSDHHFETERETQRESVPRANPKRAGRKIWGQEATPSAFSASNNCRDRHRCFFGC